MTLSIPPQRDRNTGVQLLGYAPHRDLANNFPKFAAAAVRGLADPTQREEWLQQLIDAGHLTEMQVAAATEKLVDGIRVYVEDQSIGSPKAALEQTGFLHQPELAQAVVLAKFGQIVYCGYLWAAREITPAGGTLPEPNNADLRWLEQLIHDLRDKIWFVSPRTRGWRCIKTGLSIWLSGWWAPRRGSKP